MPRTTKPLSAERWSYLKSLKRPLGRYFHQGGTYVRQDTKSLCTLLGRQDVRKAHPAYIALALQAYEGDDKYLRALKEKLA